jgi:hypothetical protein
MPKCVDWTSKPNTCGLMVDVLVLVISLADTKDLVSITLNTHTRSQPSDIGAKLAPCSLLLLVAPRCSFRFHHHGNDNDDDCSSQGQSLSEHGPRWHGCLICRQLYASHCTYGNDVFYRILFYCAGRLTVSSSSSSL